MCNVPRRGWQNGVGGCPNIGGICIGCTMPGFPDKFMPFMDEPLGSKFSVIPPQILGPIVRAFRKMTTNKLNREPAWRHKGRKIETGYTGNYA
jgi:hydrogenase small subunit